MNPESAPHLPEEPKEPDKVSEKKSSIQSYVGKETPGLTKELARKLLEEQFETQERLDKEGEREKTPEDIQIINLANQATNKVIESYGFTPWDVPEKNTHLIQGEFWKNKSNGGSCTLLHQGILIRDYGSKMVEASLVFHEMLHFKSYGSVELRVGKIEQLRTGLETRTRPERKKAFEFLNEAVISELQSRFILTLKEMPLFAEEAEETKSTIAASNKLQKHEGAYYAVPNHDRTGYIVADVKHYKPQRDVLFLLMQKIQERNETDFKSTEDVFKVFVRGLFTPNLLAVGKLIDTTFGVGTFRHLASIEGGLKVLSEYVQSL